MPSFQTPWWQRFPDVLERERQGFVVSGMEAEFDTSVRIGQMVARTVYRVGEREIRLDVIYPPEFPYFRPEIIAEGESFSIHQGLIDKKLCMTGSRSGEWYQFKTAAALIQERMPDLLSDNDNKIEHLDDQAAPVSSFFQYTHKSAIIVDGDWYLPNGVFDATVKASVSLKDTGFDFIRGVVSEIRRRKDRSILRRMDERQGHNILPVKLSCPIIVGQSPALLNDPKEQVQALSAIFPVAAQRPWVELANEYGKFSACMFGISFKEEVKPGVKGQGYQFFFIIKTRNGEEIHRIRAMRGGLNDIGTRVPQVRGLRHKTITLNGAGAIGSPAALEFARNGVGHLRINDPDYFDIATSPRWALGFPSTGGVKSVELLSFISVHHPRTAVSATGVCIGMADHGDSLEAYNKMMASMFGDTNIIVDMSAEIAVQNFLHDLSMEHGVPFVFASATSGAEGGLVGRFMPGSRKGCWYCMQCALHAEEGDPTQKIPPPDISDDGAAFPAGCTHPTFSGAGFDLQEVSLQTVRMTTQALLDDNTDSIVARLGFTGKSRIPTWEEFEIVPRPECAACSGKLALQNLTGT